MSKPLVGHGKDVTSDLESTTAVDMRSLLDPPDPAPQALVLDGRYRVNGMIATGGVAVVVRALDELLDRQVAVKLLRESTDTEDDRARFLLESQTLARLSHPGLVTLLDAGTHHDQPYLVMELVDGPSLSASLDVPMPPALLAGIGVQVATALAYIHEQEVVHRDVKPGNVLVRRDGRVKLADFGIARVLGEHSHRTKTGVIVGSVHYLAPEQVAFEEITPAVDVYALGLLLLRALTGRHAFDGPTVESALARLTADPDVPADLPSGWRDLIAAMTIRDPGDRPDAQEVTDRLSWLAGDRPTTKILPPAPMLLASERRGTDLIGGVRERLAGLLPGVSSTTVLGAVAVLGLVLALTIGLRGGEPVGASGDAATPGFSVTRGAPYHLAADVKPASVPAVHPKPHHAKPKPHPRHHHGKKHPAKHKKHRKH